MFTFEMKHNNHSYAMSLDMAEHSKVVSALLEEDEFADHVSVTCGSKDSFSLIALFIHQQTLPDLLDESYFELFLLANYLDFSNVIDELIKTLASRMIRARQIPDRVFSELKHYFDSASYFLPTPHHLISFYHRQGLSDEEVEKRLERAKLPVENYSDCFWQFKRCIIWNNFEVFKRLVPCFYNNVETVRDLVQHGRLEMLQFCIEYAKIDPVHYIPNIAIEIAAEHNQLEMFKFLFDIESLRNELWRNSYAKEVLGRDIIRNDSAEMLHTFLKHYPDYRFYNNPYKIAFQYPHTHHVILALLEYPRFDTFTDDPVFWAMKQKRYDLLRKCLECPRAKKDCLKGSEDPEIQKIYWEFKTK